MTEQTKKQLSLYYVVTQAKTIVHGWRRKQRTVANAGRLPVLAVAFRHLQRSYEASPVAVRSPLRNRNVKSLLDLPYFIDPIAVDFNVIS